MSTADIRAEIFDGAAGCASGSQTWNGMMPAFTPKPMKNKAKSPSRSGPDTTVPANISGNANEPDAADSVMKPAIRQPVATCDMTR